MTDRTESGIGRRPRVAVVGGGLTGLVAACAAARAGAAVTLLEAARTPGGRASTRTLDGYRFNQGPHALYRAGPGMPVLRTLGVDPDGAQPPTTGLTALDGARLAGLPTGPLSLLATRLLGPADKPAALRALARLPRLDPRAYDSVPWGRARAELAGRPRVQRLLDALVRLTSYAHAPDTVSGGAVLAQLQLAFSGVLYLHHGWGQLVDALVRRAERDGVGIRCGAPVRLLAAGAAGDDDGAAGIGLQPENGPGVAADAVVLALPYREARRLLGAEAGLDAAGDALLPARAACLDLGLSALPRPSRGFALGTDQPWYFAVHSATARLAPDGRHLVHAARYLGPAEPADRESHLGELEAMLDRVQPGWREAVVRRRFAPDLRVADGLPAARAGGPEARPRVDAPAAPGVFVAGDWVGPTGLLSDAARVSGFEAGTRAARRAFADAPGRRGAATSAAAGVPGSPGTP